MVVALLLAAHIEVTMAAVFAVYLLCGMACPWLSRRGRREIEAEASDLVSRIMSRRKAPSPARLPRRAEGGFFLFGIGRATVRSDMRISIQ